LGHYAKTSVAGADLKFCVLELPYEESNRCPLQVFRELGDRPSALWGVVQ